MEAKDVAVWQRDIGDDISGGSRPVTTGYRKSTGWRTEIGYEAHTSGRVCTTR